MLSQKLDEHSFDFWLGDWEAVWTQSDGSKVHGINEIKGIANNTVLQENFFDPSSSFSGTSISVFNPATQVWHQAWADSNGVFFNFEGILIEGDPAFKTKTIEKDGKKIIQRMVFKDIKKDSFTWVWEGTRNGGSSWNELWKIYYTRK
jgi:hypothetical protein